MTAKENLKIKISGYEGFATRTEKTLPFWVSTIGTASFQPPVHRPLGIDDHQLLYTLSGCGEALLNGKALSLKSGTVYYLPPGTPHEYHAESGIWKTLYITFGGCGMHSFFGEAFSAEVDRSVDFAEAYRELLRLKSDPSAYKALSLKLYELLLKLSPYAGHGIEPSKKTDSLISHAMRLLGAPRNVYVDEVSRQLGISEAYLCRIFKKHTGYAPVEYMNRLKVNRACALLRNGHYSVGAIAAAAGFESTNYFCRIFKRYKGLSPLQYRKECSQGAGSSGSETSSDAVRP